MDRRFGAFFSRTTAFAQSLPDSQRVDSRARVRWKDDDSIYDVQLSVRRWLPLFDRNLHRKNMQK
jgi:hypothetical protein